MKIQNILSQIKNPVKRSIIIKKIVRRIFSNSSNQENEKNLNWLNENAILISDYAGQMDPLLWEESIEKTNEIETVGKTKLASLPVSIGGGGASPLLYFLTRKLQPEVIVETGVAAGYSSFAFLAAITKNKWGRLYSSDFPYFRLQNPEQYIGILVPQELRNYWNLYIEGDENNLPKIVDSVSAINLFHYDSDKTFEGRRFGLETVKPKLTSKSVIIFDDIQDNCHFYELTKSLDPAEWKIFRFENKFVGMYGNINNL